MKENKKMKMSPGATFHHPLQKPRVKIPPLTSRKSMPFGHFFKRRSPLENIFFQPDRRPQKAARRDGRSPVPPAREHAQGFIYQGLAAGGIGGGRGAVSPPRPVRLPSAARELDGGMIKTFFFVANGPGMSSC